MSLPLYLIAFALIIILAASSLIFAGVAILKIAVICVLILAIVIFWGILRLRLRHPPK